MAKIFFDKEKTHLVYIDDCGDYYGIASRNPKFVQFFIEETFTKSGYFCGMLIDEFSLLCDIIKADLIKNTCVIEEKKITLEDLLKQLNLSDPPNWWDMLNKSL